VRRSFRAEQYLRSDTGRQTMLSHVMDNVS
jgi:hypothetical protein